MVCVHLTHDEHLSEWAWQKGTFIYWSQKHAAHQNEHVSSLPDFSRDARTVNQAALTGICDKGGLWSNYLHKAMHIQTKLTNLWKQCACLPLIEKSPSWCNIHRWKYNRALAFACREDQTVSICSPFGTIFAMKIQAENYLGVFLLLYLKQIIEMLPAFKSTDRCIREKQSVWTLGTMRYFKNVYWVSSGKQAGF